MDTSTTLCSPKGSGGLSGPGDVRVFCRVKGSGGLGCGPICSRFKEEHFRGVWVGFQNLELRVFPEISEAFGVAWRT